MNYKCAYQTAWMIRLGKFIHLKCVDFIFFVDAKKELIAMRTLQQTTPLEIRSSPSILSSLDQLLIDRCSFMYNNRLSCYATKIQSLSGAQIQLDTYTGGDRRLIKVYTRYGLTLKAPPIICRRRQFKILLLFKNNK